MTVRRKVIIDTDPGVDDVLALLLALASPELEVLAITTVHGNIDVINTTRNVISLFKVLYAASLTKQGGEEDDDATAAWTKRLFAGPPIVLAAGARTPCRSETQLDAAYFHGRDGLGGVSDVYPQYLPSSDWISAFPSLTAGSVSPLMSCPGILVSPRAAHEEITAILDREEAGTVTVVAVGPLTNLSHCLTHSPNTFSRVAEVVIMGGALMVPGNVTPNAEFNFLADAEAAAHVLSYTSPTPHSTWSQSRPSTSGSRRSPLRVTLLPLDTTTKVTLSYPDWHRDGAAPGLLKAWCDVFLGKTFETMSGLYTDSSIERVNLAMHDPACIWYLIAALEHAQTMQEEEGEGGGGWVIRKGQDVRVECQGTWTRGSCVIDRRGRQRIQEGVEDIGSDAGSWLHDSLGNRVDWVVQTPPSSEFVALLMGRVFGA